MLKPFFTYYGGKWRLAPRYPKPRYDKICEPFAGSAGYSLRYADRQVVLCDLSPVICGVWSYLIRSSPTEILALPDLEIGQRVDDLRVCQEARWLIGFWLNKGTVSPSKTPSKWMRGQTRPASFWGGAIRERIASQVHEIRHWRVLNCSYTQLKSRDKVTWFVDPPYNNRAGSFYPYGSCGFDYSALAAWCKSRTGQVIVCENAGADWLPFHFFTDGKATPKKGGEGKTPAVTLEAIWTNDNECE